MMQIIHNGKTDLTDFVSGAKLSGDSDKFNETLSLTMTATNDGRKQAFKIEEGDTITFKYNGDVRFVGIIFAFDLSSDGSLNVTCYDSNVYLTKSKDSRLFVNKKASDIVRMIAKDFEIPTETIADTGYVIPYLRLSKQSLYDMILKALTITQKQTGKRFFIGNKNGKLTLTEGASNTRYLFSDSNNLLSAQYSRSIEDTKTQAKVIGGPKGKQSIVVVKGEEKRRKYGVLQTIEELDEKASPSQVKQRANQLLIEESEVSEQLSIEALGVIEVKSGTPVYVKNEMTSTNGAYYVTSYSHDFKGGLHTMSLELTRTYELPDIAINEDELKPEEATEG